MTKETLDQIIIEFKETRDRTNKLREFIFNQEKFNELGNIDKDLLIAQLKAMETYISILSIRIGINVPVAISEDSKESETTSTNE